MKYFFLLIAIYISVISCSKQKPDLPNIQPPHPIYKELPTVTTLDAKSITLETAIIGCTLVSNGKDIITEMGICYSFNNTLPTNQGEKIFINKEVNTFSDTIKKLAPNTTYYARAYAINNIGVAYGKVIKFTTPNYTIKDYDGNIYNVIKIGDQYWTKENFRCEHYNDGDEIKRQLILKDHGGYWNDIGAYCYYNDDIELYKKYGALYNWDAAINYKKLAPKGWHIPTKDEFDKMLLFIYFNPSVDFYPLLGGERNEQDDNYQKIENYGFFWASSETVEGYNDYYYTFKNSYSGKIQTLKASHRIERKPGRTRYYNSPGFSVRLVKD